MRKFLTSILLLAAVFATVGCEKIDATPDGMVEIFAESMSGSKVVLDGVNATWKSGDEIRINDATATVERRDGHAYISNAALQSTNRALYPASLGVANWGTDSPTITLPAYYHYRTDGNGHQVLDLPMAAYSTSSSNPLQFKHLTGALYITVTNTGSNARTLQSVTVKSNMYALNGTMVVSLNTSELVAARTAGDEFRAVTLVFDEELVLASSESVRVMVPVCPVGSDNKFTIQVKSYEEGQTTSYLSSKSQTTDTDHSLSRNQLGYAPIDIPVGETTTPVLTFSGVYYEIRTANDFVLMTKAINGQWLDNNAAYKLMNDIDMADIELTPIDNIRFIGTIEGNNNSVNNLRINGVAISGNVYCGLFLKTGFGMTFQNITFNNLSLINENVGSSTLYVGAIEACNPNDGTKTKTFSKCTVNIGSFDDGEATGYVYFGGLIGALEAKNSVSISDCRISTSNFSLDGNNIYFGGFIGYSGGTQNAYSINIVRSSWVASGSTTINARAGVRLGGLIGQRGRASLSATDCTISGIVSVSSTTSYIGYLVGYSTASSASASNIDASSFSVSVNGSPITVNPYGN